MTERAQATRRRVVPDEPEDGRAPLPPGTAPIVAGLMLSMFLVALDGTIVSTAMPSIAGSLGGFSLYAWVPAVYLLTTAVSAPIYGKLADLFGRKRVLFVGIGLFLLGSAASGAAPSMLFLIAARALQGVGAGGVFPLTLTIIGDIFTLEQRARMQGFFSSVWGVSSVVGPLAGGIFVDNLGWRWIFYLNLPFGALAIGMIAAFFHERAAHREHQLDILGASLLTGGLTALLLFFIEGGQQWDWVSLPSAGLLLATAVCLAVFVAVERRVPEPVLPLDLFRIRIIAVGSVAMFLAGIVMISVSFEIPLYVQGVLGMDAVHAGVALAPMSIGWPLAGAFSGGLALRFGYRTTTVVGLIFCVIGVALLLTLGEHGSFVVTSGYCFLAGIGLGLASTPMLIAVQSAVTWQRRGVATATSMFVRNFGSVVGLAVMGAIINGATAGRRAGSSTNQALDIHARHGVAPKLLAHIHHSIFTGIHGAFIAALVAAVLGTAVSTLLPGGGAREHELREEAV